MSAPRITASVWRGARGLDEAGDKGPAAHRRKPAACEGTEQGADFRAGRVLQAVVQEFDAVEKEEDAAEEAR